MNKNTSVSIINYEHKIRKYFLARYFNAVPKISWYLFNWFAAA